MFNFFTHAGEDKTILAGGFSDPVIDLNSAGYEQGFILGVLMRW